MGIAVGVENTSDGQQCVLLVCGTTSAQMPPEFAKLLGTQLIMLADFARQSNLKEAGGEDGA